MSLFAANCTHDGSKIETIAVQLCYHEPMLPAGEEVNTDMAIRKES